MIICLLTHIFVVQSPNMITLPNLTQVSISPTQGNFQPAPQIPSTPSQPPAPTDASSLRQISSPKGTSIYSVVKAAPIRAPPVKKLDMSLTPGSAGAAKAAAVAAGQCPCHSSSEY